MAITKTSSILEIIVRYGGDHPEIIVHRVAKWDDPDDAELPIEKKMVEVYPKQNWNEETEAWDDNDISGADQVIQDIAAAVWA